jgi:YD repeat-containing protein
MGLTYAFLGRSRCPLAVNRCGYCISSQLFVATAGSFDIKSIVFHHASSLSRLYGHSTFGMGAQSCCLRHDDRVVRQEVFHTELTLYTWNARNQLISTNAGAASFSYDAFGRRVGATVNSVTSTYVYDGVNPLTVTGALLLGFPAIDDLFAQISSNGTTGICAMA